MTIETVTSDTLAAFNAGKLGLTELQEMVEPVVKADEAAKDAIEEAAKEDESEKPKKANKLESRFSEITEARRQAERERDELKRERDELKAKLEPKREEEASKDEIGPKPKPADYQDAFKYAEDLAEWSANKALKDRDKEEATKAETAKRDKVVESWKTRVQAAQAKYPDFNEMLSTSKAAVSDPARDTLFESEYGPDIVYELSIDDELAAKITAMKPADQVKWIGRQEAKYENAAAKADEKAETKTEEVIKERPRAPAPITPVRGAKVADSLDDRGEFKGSFAEYKALRKKQAA